MPWTCRDNPFSAPGRWFKGALHVHSTRSDGILSPGDLIAAYRERGFDFITFADHNVVTRVDSPDDDFLVIPGVELALNVFGADKYWHLVGIDARDSAATKEAFTSAADLLAHLRSKAAYCILAHPYWSQLTGMDLVRLGDVDAVEVYNGGSELEIGRGISDYQWDWLLSTGRRLNAVAVDDCHKHLELGSGWVMVKSETLATDAIIDALRRGCFYSSAGPEFRDVRVIGDRIEVETTPARSIGFVADRQKGARFEAGKGATITRAAFDRRGPECYVRIQCVDAAGGRAWTNPYYVEQDEAPPTVQ